MSNMVDEREDTHDGAVVSEHWFTAICNSAKQRNLFGGERRGTGVASPGPPSDLCDFLDKDSLTD